MSLCLNSEHQIICNVQHIASLKNLMFTFFLLQPAAFISKSIIPVNYKSMYLFLNVIAFGNVNN